MENVGNGSLLSFLIWDWSKEVLPARNLSKLDHIWKKKHENASKNRSPLKINLHLSNVTLMANNNQTNILVLCHGAYF